MPRPSRGLCSVSLSLLFHLFSGYVDQRMYKQVDSGSGLAMAVTRILRLAVTVVEWGTRNGSGQWVDETRQVVRMRTLMLPALSPRQLSRSLIRR